jgi:hypothetical protein
MDGVTPFEAWHGRKPNVSHLRVFGCVAHVKVTRPGLKKLDDRSVPMVFLGYEQGSKAYRLFDPAANRVHVSRDVVFDEDASWDWSESGHATDDTPFVVEFLVHGGAPVPAAESSAATQEATATSTPSPDGGKSPPSPLSRDSAASPASPPAASTSSTPTMPPPASFVSPPAGADDMLDADDDPEHPHRYRLVTDLQDKSPAVHARAKRLFFVEEPGTFSEAEPHECWRMAMLDELKAIEDNATWTLTDLPAGHRPIGLKWVFKTKRDEAGAVVKHKARLVAKGYVQREGVDFDEVYAPVARLDSVRVLVAIAAQQKWQVHHLDVKSAFLNGDLQEEVYVTQPPGFERDGEKGKVYRLHKALYGLRQAPRA